MCVIIRSQRDHFRLRADRSSTTVFTRIPTFWNLKFFRRFILWHTRSSFRIIMKFIAAITLLHLIHFRICLWHLYVHYVSIISFCSGKVYFAKLRPLMCTHTHTHTDIRANKTYAYCACAHNGQWWLCMTRGEKWKEKITRRSV